MFEQPQQQAFSSRRRFLMLAPLAIGGGAAISWGVLWGRRGDADGLPRRVGETQQVTIVEFGPTGERIGTSQVNKIVRPDSEWFQRLSHEQYYVTRRKNTDTPFSGTYFRSHASGLYRCICCDVALFSSATKYDSGTGWPAFTEPIAKENVRLSNEVGATLSNGIEVLCVRCDAHLGHVFDDGPPPAHLRYCINESSLRFVG